MNYDSQVSKQNRINIKQFYTHKVLSHTDYSSYHISSYYLVNLVLLKYTNQIIRVNIIKGSYVCSSSSIHLLFCIFCCLSFLSVVLLFTGPFRGTHFSLAHLIQGIGRSMQSLCVTVSLLELPRLSL